MSNISVVNPNRILGLVDNPKHQAPAKPTADTASKTQDEAAELFLGALAKALPAPPETTIKDADEAKGLLALAQASMLQQAAETMAAQANHSPHSVLQLLQ
jgi:flagellin-like hook-associated protein FlgL